MAPNGVLPSSIHIRRFEELRDLLAGKVFHVTTQSGYESIKSAGEIRPNNRGASSPFGNSSNGYFRKRGCVSLFDYRALGTKEWEEHAYKCLPTLPLEEHASLVFLFLHPANHSQLLPWIRWKEEEAWSDRVVPHVEVGYLGPLPLSSIETILIVSRALS